MPELRQEDLRDALFKGQVGPVHATDQGGVLGHGSHSCISFCLQDLLSLPVRNRQGKESLVPCVTPRERGTLKAASSHSLAIPILLEGSTNLPAADKPNPAKMLLSAVPSTHVHAQYLFLPWQREPVFTDNSVCWHQQWGCR